MAPDPKALDPDRRLHSADDLHKCLAFDAVSAVHVADLTVLTPKRPETTANEVLPEQDVDLLHTILVSQDHRKILTITAKQMPDTRVAAFYLGSLVGSHPSPRWPPRGTRKVRQELARQNSTLQVREAIHKRRK